MKGGFCTAWGAGCSGSGLQKAGLRHLLCCHCPHQSGLAPKGAPATLYCLCRGTCGRQAVSPGEVSSWRATAHPPSRVSVDRPMAGQ